MNYRYGKTFNISNLDREEAIILINGKFYSSTIHQYAVLQYKENFYEGKIKGKVTVESLDEDYLIYGKACDITDECFKKCEMIGLDLFCGDNEDYLLFHYPQSIKEPNVLELCKKYADVHGYKLGTFIDENKLSDIAQLIIFN